MRWWSSTCRFPAITWASIKAIENAGRILKETRCQAVKLEGGADQADVIRGLVSAGIPVMAHCRAAAAKRACSWAATKCSAMKAQLMADARAAEEAGAFAIVLECIPGRAGGEDHASRCGFPRSASAPARAATARCWSINDLLGLTSGYVPRFVKAYADLKAAITDAVTRFRDDVRDGKFPTPEQAFQVMSLASVGKSCSMPNRLAQREQSVPAAARRTIRWIGIPGGRGARRAPSRNRSRSFLSIGYSACHWCHVMEHESFENAAIARLMNEHFVCIKVDREERPDLDQIYMNAVQIDDRPRRLADVGVSDARLASRSMAARIGRRRARMGMPGFDQVLSAVAEAWQNRRGAGDRAGRRS